MVFAIKILCNKIFVDTDRLCLSLLGSVLSLWLCQTA